MGPRRAIGSLSAMEPTVLGILAILAVPPLIFTRPRCLFYLGIFFAPFSGTAVVNIPALTFGLPASLFFFAGYAAALVLRGRAFREIRITQAQAPPLFLLLLFLLILFASLWRPSLEGSLRAVNITMVLYVAFNAGIALLTAWTIRDAATLLTALKVQAAAALFVSLWGFYQFFGFLVGLSYPDWLFNTSASDAALLHGSILGVGLVRVGSVAVEPSILVQSLAYFVAIAGTLVVRGKRILGRWQTVPLVAAIGCMILATSTTGFVGLGVLAALLLLQSTVRSIGFMALAAAVAAALLIVEPQLLAGILENTVEKSTSWSFDKRTGGMLEGLALFVERPVLGWGWATQSANSLPVFLLANTGVIGTAVFVLFLATLSLKLVQWAALRVELRAESVPDDGLPLSDLAVALLNALVVSLVMQAVAGSTHVFPDFWIFTGLVLGLAGLASPVSRTSAPAMARDRPLSARDDTAQRTSCSAPS
jgi:hypothetical protein